MINLDKKKFDVVLLCLGSVKESPYIEELGRDRRIRVIYADKKLNGQDPEFANAGGVAVPMPKQFTLTLRLGL